jgi:hypothetical protein
MSNDNEEFKKALPGMLPALEVAFNAGVHVGEQRGLIAGEMVGYLKALNDVKPALSDGLRHGSPECGRLMQSLRNIGFDGPTEGTSE